MKKARLAQLELPDFGAPTAMPELPAEVYAARLERLHRRMSERALDVLLVYADREHSANLAYLSGFDPRFEAALLIVAADREPAILVGNECWRIADAAPLPMRRHMFQDFSLPSQPRHASRPLAEILRIEARRDFMAEMLGILLHPDVLPLSNIPAYLPPFLLRPDRALTLG